MHYAEFAEDEVRNTARPDLHLKIEYRTNANLFVRQSMALMNAIKEYENNKWKVIGQKVGKPAKACEQYAKEHFPGTNKQFANVPGGGGLIMDQLLAEAD